MNRHNRVLVIHDGMGARIGCTCGSVLELDTNDQQGFFALMEAWRVRHPEADEIAYADALEIRRREEAAVSAVLAKARTDGQSS